MQSQGWAAESQGFRPPVSAAAGLRTPEALVRVRRSGDASVFPARESRRGPIHPDAAAGIIPPAGRSRFQPPT